MRRGLLLLMDEPNDWGSDARRSGQLQEIHATLSVHGGVKGIERGKLSGRSDKELSVPITNIPRPTELGEPRRPEPR